MLGADREGRRAEGDDQIRRQHAASTGVQWKPVAGYRGLRAGVFDADGFLVEDFTTPHWFVAVELDGSECKGKKRVVRH